jgi:SAM-dependent methyltransferase
MTKFHIKDWKSQLKDSDYPKWKKVIVFFARPLFDAITRRHLTKVTIEKLRPQWVLPDGRCFPLETRQRWGSAFAPLINKTILVQGTGNGWDTIGWAKFKPGKIIAVDLFEFDSWQEITKYVQREYSIKIDFYAAPLHELTFIRDGSIDLCASHTVLEHVKNLNEVMIETYRILKPGGIVYATYGPLWYCAGGDHFGRGALKNYFNHILLDHEDYLNYFNSVKEDVEDFQSGGRYIELDLFSKLRTEEYLNIYRDNGFLVEALVLEVSRKALIFRKYYPELFNELKNKKVFCNEDDFLIKTNIIRLRKQQ